jgi:hypothetical protein
MSQRPTGDGRQTGELEAALMRDLGLDKTPPRHSTLKLQPVILPPPPTGVPAESGALVSDQPVTSGATSDDDLDPALLGGNRKRSFTLPLLLIMLVAIAGGTGWLVFGNRAPGPEASVPTIQAPQPAELKALPPAPAETAEVPPSPSVPLSVGPVATTPAPPPSSPVADQSMGSAPAELIPPSTEGLAPARKVNATRIIVEDDREVRPTR